MNPSTIGPNATSSIVSLIGRRRTQLTQRAALRGECATDERRLRAPRSIPATRGPAPRCLPLRHGRGHRAITRASQAAHRERPGRIRGRSRPPKAPRPAPPDVARDLPAGGPNTISAPTLPPADSDRRMPHLHRRGRVKSSVRREKSGGHALMTPPLEP
jgi:hypothetical protein